MNHEESLKDVNIQHFRLADGIEIVAYVNSTEDGYLLVERPMEIVLANTTNGMSTYFFSKFMPLAESEDFVRVNKRSIIALSSVSDDLKERYIRSAIKDDLPEVPNDELHDDEDSDKSKLVFSRSPSKCYH